VTINKQKHIKAVVTAGPTVESIDPVRFLSNFSTGVMGYEIAKACRDAGFQTCLVTGPVSLEAPAGVDVIRVTTAREMRASVLARAKGADCLIMAAAVCDFRPEKVSVKKIKKSAGITLRLVRNPDILAEASGKKGLIKVGFALETDRGESNAVKKLKAKGLDLIVLNTKKKGADPFGGGKKDFTLIDSSLRLRRIRGVSKQKFARELVGEVERMLK
jgi:phosphopantothenoylcysteine decarboxylase / phosphopantothenate---cysteine ligase